MVCFGRGDMLRKQLSYFRSTWELYLRPSLTYEVGAVEYDDFKPSEEPVYILGRKYSTFHELDDLRTNITSKVWLTYRRNFPAISGTDYTSDTGWGCMLRCGQMVVAEALMRRHLGKDWQWSQETKDENYLRVLRMFQDKKNCTYSIHQIAQMGVSEGKTVGQWFGPNTIAHVLRQLSAFDKWSSIAMHVAMDNVVVMDDIRKVCRVETSDAEGGVRNRTQSHGLAAAAAYSWKPLVLFIPLRLGLSEINPIYYCGLKVRMDIKKCYWKMAKLNSVTEKACFIWVVHKGECSCCSC
ncbi:cysteine protease ATG4B isoform X1 [Dermacentor silvarum]|uniref:cysteine protease ATG4B isoform X1 n=1 Tax=Dermacentor silvarum TaxID=543639 RepID=UPI002100CD39|nr:cysteine protease ATG4B isoform X1 [Dermacentor silvarum]